MNDFDYDAMQKKRIARGAAHMKRGSKSKKCTLPSDHLTPAQLKRRNGPVATYKLDAPMKWEEFKSMPLDLKRKYLNYLYDVYGATDVRIGAMMGVNAMSISRARAEVGIVRKGNRVGAEELKRREAMWDAFCNGVVGGEPEEKPRVLIDDLEKVEPAEEPPISLETPIRDTERINEGFRQWSENLIPTTVAMKPELALTDLTATFRGEFDPEKFLHWVTKLPMPSGTVKIRVEVTAE